MRSTQIRDKSPLLRPRPKPDHQINSEHNHPITNSDPPHHAGDDKNKGWGNCTSRPQYLEPSNVKRNFPYTPSQNGNSTCAREETILASGLQRSLAEVIDIAQRKPGPHCAIDGNRIAYWARHFADRGVTRWSVTDAFGNVLAKGEGR